MRELAQELAGAPEEVTADLPGMDTAAAVAARQRLEARAAAEEDLMLRVPLSKAEAKKLKAQRRWVCRGGVYWWPCSAAGKYGAWDLLEFVVRQKATGLGVSIGWCSSMHKGGWV